METHSSQQPDVSSKWRDFFGTASGSDIFDIIEQAIKIATSDFPTELLLQRDGIAEMLFTCNLPKKKTTTSGTTDNTTTCRPGSGAVDVVINDTTKGVTRNITRKRDDDGDDVLSDEESRVYAEVLRIKREFDRSCCRSQEDRSSSVSGLCDMLRRLRAMGLSMKTLEDTQIVKSVHGIRYKHWLNNNVRGLVRELIEGWRVTINTNNARGYADSKNPKKPSSAPQLVDDQEQVKKQSFDKSDHHHRVNKPKPSTNQEKENTTNNIPMKMKQMKSAGQKPAAAVTKYCPEGRRAQVVGGGVHRQESLKRKPSELDDAPYEVLSRRFQERYERAESAKRQRRVQVIDWRDMPRRCLEQTRDYPTSTRPLVNWGR